MTETAIVVEVSSDLDITRCVLQCADDVLFLTDTACHGLPGALNLHKSNIGFAGGFPDCGDASFIATGFAVSDSAHCGDYFCGEVLP